jgi:transposase
MYRYFAWEIISGGYTKELFKAFIIRQVLPYCNLYLGLRSILLIDNTSQHDIPRLRAICSRYGVHVEELPLYSPELNLIELSFRVIKAWIRRHWTLIEEFNNLGQFLHVAVQACMVGKDCRGMYARCGYKAEALGVV